MYMKYVCANNCLCLQPYLRMVSPDVCQQLVDEPTHQSSWCVNSSYELRDHLCKQTE